MDRYSLLLVEAQTVKSIVALPYLALLGLGLGLGADGLMLLDAVWGKVSATNLAAFEARDWLGGALRRGGGGLQREVG